MAGGVSANVQAIMTSATEALAAVPSIANPKRAQAEMANYEKMQMRLQMHEDVISTTLDDDGTNEEAEAMLEQVRDGEGWSERRGRAPQAAGPAAGVCRSRGRPGAETSERADRRTVELERRRRGLGVYRGALEAVAGRLN